jgi:ABC-type multidrug transport system ATPase subunit
MNPFLDLKNIKKSFGTQVLFENASLYLEKGDCCWLAGENGIGKSTLLKCIVGLEPIQTGQIIKQGHSISILSENDWLYPQLSIIENLKFWALINDSEVQDQLLTLFSLTDILDQKVDTISQGMRKKVALTRTLQNNASIILLDEPYTYLDEKNIDLFNQYLLSIKGQKAILIATHDRKNVIKIINKKYKITDQKIEYQKEL